ncbi:MAG: ion channel [Pseudomonadota bacterium]
MRETLRALYNGHTDRARLFRFGLIVFDILSILFFVATSMIEDQTWIYVVDGILAVLIASDLGARLWISDDPLSQLKEVMTWIDIVVIVTLLLPTLLSNFLFLRVVRALRLLRSYRVLSDLRRDWAFFRRNEEVIQSALNLGVFLFIMTALVYVLQVNSNPNIKTYVDALYFTVTTLTTTGFGDITLQGTSGRILSVLIMIFGVALFLRLVQTIFRPSQVRFPCPDCGLQRHDADAVHCKHCGRVLNIPTEGRDF